MGDYSQQLINYPPDTGRYIKEDGNLTNLARILDNVFDSANNALRISVQGGEQFSNWEVVGDNLQPKNMALDVTAETFNVAENGFLLMNDRPISLGPQAAILKGDDPQGWLPLTDWTFDNDEGSLIVQGITFDYDANFNVTLSASKNPQENDSNIRFNSPTYFDDDSYVTKIIGNEGTTNKSIILETNNESAARKSRLRMVADDARFYIQTEKDSTGTFQPLSIGGDYNSTNSRFIVQDTSIDFKVVLDMENNGIDRAGDIDLDNNDLIDATSLNVNGTFATSTEIIPPIVRLSNGQKLGGEQQGSQIKFSLYEFDTERYSHFLTTTHSGSSESTNRIDIYTCDTTDQNSVDSGVNHAFTFSSTINKSRQPFSTDGNNLNLEGGSVVFDSNNALSKSGNDWQFSSFGAESGNFGFLTNVDLNSNRLFNASQVAVNDTSNMQTAAQNAKGFFAPDNVGDNIDVMTIVAGDEDKEARFFLSAPFDGAGSFRNNAFKNAIITRGMGTWGRGEFHFCLNNTSGTTGGAGGTGANDPVNNASLSDSRFVIYPNGNIELVDGTFNCNGPINILGVAATTAGSADPILRLQQGQQTGNDGNAAQVSFGYEGANTYQHFFTSTHSSQDESQNRLGVYLCDGTENNSMASGRNHAFNFGAVTNESIVPLETPTPTSGTHAANKTYVDDNRVYFAACDAAGNNTNDNLPTGITYSVVYDGSFTYYTYTFSQNVGGEGSAVGASADNGGLRVEAAFPDADDVRVNPAGQSANNIFVMFN